MLSKKRSLTWNGAGATSTRKRVPLHSTLLSLTLIKIDKKGITFMKADIVIYDRNGQIILVAEIKKNSEFCWVSSKMETQYTFTWKSAWCKIFFNSVTGSFLSLERCRKHSGSDCSDIWNRRWAGFKTISGQKRNFIWKSQLSKFWTHYWNLVKFYTSY